MKTKMVYNDLPDVDTYSDEYIAAMIAAFGKEWDQE